MFPHSLMMWVLIVIKWEPEKGEFQLTAVWILNVGLWRGPGVTFG